MAAVGAVVAAVAPYIIGGAAAGVVAGNLLKPDAPPAPPEPDEFGLVTDPDEREKQRQGVAQQAQVSERQRAAAATGQKSRTLTDPLGLTGDVAGEQRSLLGL